jgi:predicted ATPase
MLKSKRQQYHQQIAQVLAEQFADVGESQPELLAHHYTEAGLIAEAIPYWQQAGQRAVQRSAHVEAISQLTKGVELLRTLLETPERNQQELFLLATLGVSLTVVKGHAAPEVEHLYTHARALCRQAGDTPQLYLVLWGLGAFYFVRGQTRTALELGTQLLSQGESQTEAGPRMLGHYHLATVLLLRGELVGAMQHFEQVLSIYDSRVHRQLAHLYGFDLGVPSHALLGWALWLLGYPERALQHEQVALTLAQESGHPFSQAYARLLLAFLQVFRQDATAAHTHATAGIDISSEQDFVLFAAYCMSIQGWAEAQQGHLDTGIATMRRGLDEAAATGAELLRAFFLTGFAHVTGNVGQSEEGLRVLVEAQQVAERTGERFYEAELYRLKGELVLQSQVESPKSKVDEAEECFLKAIEIARGQSAKSLELRSTVCLARLWQRQGRYREARRMLSEIDAWFTEGFDTADLKEAKTLLGTLTDC